MTPINVTVRIEPDRWVGIVYDGTEKKAGFTNESKPSPENYILISNEQYENSYLTQIWNTVKTKATYDASTPGLQYYGIAKTDAGDYTYDIDFKPSDLPEDPNYSVSLFVRQGRKSSRRK